MVRNGIRDEGARPSLLSAVPQFNFPECCLFDTVIKMTYSNQGEGEGRGKASIERKM